MSRITVVSVHRSRNPIKTCLKFPTIPNLRKLSSYQRMLSKLRLRETGHWIFISLTFPETSENFRQIGGFLFDEKSKNQFDMWGRTRMVHLDSKDGF